MTGGRKPKPLRWQGSDAAIKAVQVAFDVEMGVLDAVRRAAFENRMSSSDQIRLLLDLPVTQRPQRPRLTVSLTQHDYQTLSERYGVPADDRLGIKEKVIAELVAFSEQNRKK